MKVVMLVDVKKVGQRGSVVEVADGYAMNVLFPKKQALPGTPENLKKVEKAALAEQGKRDMDAALASRALSDVNGKTIPISAKANDAGGLFVAIREKQIAEATLKATGISLPDSAFKLDKPIKKIGSYKVPVSIRDARASVIVEISG